MLQWRFRIIQSALLDRHITQARQRLNVIGMSDQELLQDRSSSFEITSGTMGVSAQVFDVLNLRVELCCPIEVGCSCGPFSLTIVGVRPRIDVGRFVGVYLDGFRVLLNGAIPETDGGVFAGQ